MEEFPSQSHKAREPREIQPVTRSAGRVRKAPFGRRFRETFIQGDAQSVWSSMIWNSFFPGLRDQVNDALHQGLDSLFNGGTTAYRRAGHSSSRGSNISRHNPDRALGGGRRENEVLSREDRHRQDTSVIELDSRAEAEAVLDAMIACIDQFDVVTLAEFYQLVRITPEHTDYKFGWEDLGGARIAHSRGSYYLDLPPVVVIR